MEIIHTSASCADLELREDSTTNLTNLTNKDGRLEYRAIVTAKITTSWSRDRHEVSLRFVRFVLFVVKINSRIELFQL